MPQVIWNFVLKVSQHRVAIEHELFTDGFLLNKSSHLPVFPGHFLAAAIHAFRLERFTTTDLWEATPSRKQHMVWPVYFGEAARPKRLLELMREHRQTENRLH